jgi:hypothetical protein
MHKTAALIRTASDLRRRLWASMPLGYRLAHLLVALGSGALEAYGKAFYAEFLRKGVKGMPDIYGMPAEQWVAEKGETFIRNPRLADKLPRGYGYELADKVKKILLAKYRDGQLVDDAMSGFFLRYLDKGHLTFHEGVSLAEAQQFIIMSVKNELINMLRAQGKRREQSVTQESDGEEVTLDINDPNAFKALESVFPDWHKPKVRRDLMSIAVWVPAYLDMVTAGYSDNEIFGWSPAEPYSGQKPSLLARKMGEPFVPRPGTKEPLGRGLWSKPDTGTKVRILDMLNSHMAQA